MNDDGGQEVLNSKHEKVCNLKYLDEMMGGKKNLIIGIIDAFLIQIPEELKCMEEAVENSNFIDVRKFAHTMKSTVSIMGISSLATILQELENLGAEEKNIERIGILNEQLKMICDSAIKEIETIRINYIE